MTEKAAVELRGVTCRFGRVVALEAVTMTVPRGSVFGVLGPNGAGKSTLIEVVTGIVRPSAGSVSVMGFDVRLHGRRARSMIGVLPQETALYGELSAVQNLRFAAALYGVKDVDSRVDAVLELVALSARRDDAVRGFSGGMQRRLAIARSMVHSPELLILDEPTLGVDIEARHQIWMEIPALQAQGRTVILTTNYLDEAEALCDQIAILREGRLVAQDTPEALTADLGRCLDLEWAPEVVGKSRAALDAIPGVMRSELSPSGLTLYLDAASDPEALVRQAMAMAPLGGFRLRAPDLAELIRLLPARTSGE